jgi:hypothetical protein
MSGAYDGLRLAARGKDAGEDEPENELTPDSPDEETPTVSDEKEQEDMTTKNDAEDAPKGAAAIDYNARMQTVFAHESVKGREARAAEILGDPDFNGLSAEAVIKLIAGEAKPEAKADEDGPEGKTMLRMLADGADADLGVDGAEKAKADNYGWAKAHEKVAKRYGRKN